ncbi:hypothetical protein CEP54_014062 [Fusarium duplospermum]|uniref:Uncharacterized protein n=1 Tax=Fusarium duplospermum TaxID=1325734 RepID=A0A428NZ23_9HYPO|nr:hypothetical protein CEP54_014062 [Fusarium duplospermum]
MWKISYQWFEYDRKVYLGFYRDLVRQVLDGTAADYFIRDFTRQAWGRVTYAAGGLVEAESESTSTVINAWILVCQIYPNIVTAAQEDEGKLPYIHAMVKEILRFWPITKPGMNHPSTEDD